MCEDAKTRTFQHEQFAPDRPGSARISISGPAGKLLNSRWFRRRRWRGGDGGVRRIKFLGPMTAGILSNGRERGAFGMAVGEAGQVGKNLVVRAYGSVETLAHIGQAEMHTAAFSRFIRRAAVESGRLETDLIAGKSEFKPNDMTTSRMRRPLSINGALLMFVSSPEYFLEHLGVAYPLIQAPMLGTRIALAASVCEAGGLGSLACAASSVDQAREQVVALRQQTAKPFAVNFFCHAEPAPDARRDAAWLARLMPYYREFDVDPSAPITMSRRAPFNGAMCALIEEVRPPVVSFHFGLPEEKLLARVRAAGCLVLASATTVREARWLEARGVDALIAQGAEAGGHRGMFLSDAVASQIGTFALVPQIADAVGVPVIAAGGIADARGVAAALTLGASAVQVGTAYLKCPEAGIPAPHLAALRTAQDEDTVLTNVFTGRPARGLLNRVVRELGPLCADAPAFPGAAVALQPLRLAAEATRSGEFSPLWSGQAAALSQEISARELTQLLGKAAARFRAAG